MCLIIRFASLSFCAIPQRFAVMNGCERAFLNGSKFNPSALATSTSRDIFRAIAAIISRRDLLALIFLRKVTFSLSLLHMTRSLFRVCVQHLRALINWRRDYECRQDQ